MVLAGSRQGWKAKSNKPLSAIGDEVKITSLTRLGARVGQSNKPSLHQGRRGQQA
jgi:hypothetical protein